MAWKSLKAQEKFFWGIRIPPPGREPFRKEGTLLKKPLESVKKKP